MFSSILSFRVKFYSLIGFLLNDKFKYFSWCLIVISKFRFLVGKNK